MLRFARAPLAAAVLLAGCATPYASPVEVTRFTGVAPALLGRGPIAVQAAPGQPVASWDHAAFQSAVASRLERLGYTVTGDMAQQVAEISVERRAVPPGARRSPISVGIGGGTGSYGSGIGGGIGIDLTPRPGPIADTELHVIIRPSGGGTALWEGRARFSASADSRYGDARATADRLAEALFDGFPGRSGETIEVR